MKYFFLCVCIYIFSTPLLFSQEEVSTTTQAPKTSQKQQESLDEDENETLIHVNLGTEKHSYGLGHGLAIGGAVVTSFGLLLETSAILAYFLVDEKTRIRYSSDSDLFAFLHMTSATFITAGISALIGGATYVDDSVYGKKYWKETQVITGSVLTSIGAVATIAGSILYTAVNMKDMGAGIMGGGVPLMTSGMVSLFLGLFAR